MTISQMTRVSDNLWILQRLGDELLDGYGLRVFGVCVPHHRVQYYHVLRYSMYGVL